MSFSQLPNVVNPNTRNTPNLFDGNNLGSGFIQESRQYLSRKADNNLFDVDNFKEYDIMARILVQLRFTRRVLNIGRAYSLVKA